MAVDDIRIKATFKGHRKRKRLRRILGDRATDYLIDFWISVAESRPTGELTGWNAFDIADAADYPGDPDEFYNALVDVGFLDVSDNGCINVHNWTKRQGYVAHSERRSLQARLANAVRWGHTSLAQELREELYGKQILDPDRSPGSSPDRSPPSPYPLPKDYKGLPDGMKICDAPTCDKQVDQPHHSRCRSCFGSQHAKHTQPTGRHNVYPKCPYCKREQTGLIINHQAMNCSICKDQTT